MNINHKWIFNIFSRRDSVESESLLNESDNIEFRSENNSNYNDYADKFSHYFIPMIAILLPTVLSFFNENVLWLASITGSYPGVGVQFIIPSLLVLGARRYTKNKLNLQIPNSMRSPFFHDIWPIFALIWAGFTIINVTIHLFSSG